MKSILLKTLAATSLVATTHADVHVMGASFKERGVNAPNGTIITNPGTVRATRGYLIMDQTVTSTLPNLATYIEYGEIRNAGVTERFYTIDTDFAAFRADGVLGSSGGRRLYGHMYAPVMIADVANPLIPFSGTTFSSNLPKKLTFDQTVFQTGASDALAGPRILVTAPSTLRSVVSGSANHVKVAAADISEATAELVARLTKQKYVRVAGEVPEIVLDLPAAFQLQDGETNAFSITLDPDVYPGLEDTFAGPTFQWFKDNAPIPGAVTDSYTVTGGPSTATNGAGTYRVTATNTLGSVSSTSVVVTPETTSFSTDLPATSPLVGANSVTLAPVLNPVPIVTPTYQWVKSTTLNGTYNNIPANLGGNNPSLVVIGGEAATGVGFYRLDVTTSAGLVSTAVCNVTVTAATTTSFAFTPNNLARTVAVSFSGTSLLNPAIPTGSVPAVASRQWYKASTSDPTNFVAIPTGEGGNAASFTVSGNVANSNGPGIYRMVATSTTSTTLTTVDCVVTSAP